jgi:hypothetical protein
MKGFTGYAEMMLRNPENPKIGGIGVQTIFPNPSAEAEISSPFPKFYTSHTHTRHFPYINRFLCLAIFQKFEN